MVLLTSCDSDGRGSSAGRANTGERPYARYIGTLPCVDCRAIRWDLLLHQGLRGAPARFSLRKTRLRAVDAVEDAAIELHGSWSTRAAPALSGGLDMLRLEPDTSKDSVVLLRIGESQLRPLGAPTAALAGGGVLQRVESRRDPDAIDATIGDVLAPIQLRSGQVLRVHLPVSPATGYRWDLDGAVPPALRIESDPGTESAERVMPVHTWDFRAQQAGAMRLRFAYRRSWEASASPLWSVAFDVQVR
ncbi:protease inhibitor I42 family protein [Lysobacter cavernae]|uniref:Protease inhibitor I42 family protein n=1 Tax=Lysobacter cavernae TaxID=1685901 RepID=A0ABV7RL20_9GAMM